MHARTSHLFAAAVTAATLIALPAAAQSTFEGVVTIQVDAGPSGQQPMQYSVKGNKVRMDISTQGMQMVMLFDGATHTMDMVIPMRQMYMERTVDDPRVMADSVVAASKIDWTGKKETIAGYACEHANITDDQGQATDVCLAKGLGGFVQVGSGMGGRGSMGGGWEGHIGQLFPLKVERNGAVEMLVTKIEKKSIDDSIFSIPDGYQKMTMPGRGGR
jgi:Domain of unknown function (DUF4412)